MLIIIGDCFCLLFGNISHIILIILNKLKKSEAYLFKEMLRKNVYELILIKVIWFFYIIKPVVELFLLMYLINQWNNGISITCVNYKTRHFINPKIQQLYNQSPTSTTLLKHNIPAAYVLLIKQHYSCMKVFIKLR